MNHYSIVDVLVCFKLCKVPEQDYKFRGGAAPLQHKPRTGSKFRWPSFDPMAASFGGENERKTETSATERATGRAAETQGKKQVEWA